MAVFMASNKASGMTGTTVNLTMGSLTTSAAETAAFLASKKSKDNEMKIADSAVLVTGTKSGPRSCTGRGSLEKGREGGVCRYACAFCPIRMGTSRP
jgi:uncharacterized protein (DUF2237 family)